MKQFMLQVAAVTLLVVGVGLSSRDGFLGLLGAGTLGVFVTVLPAYVAAARR